MSDRVQALLFDLGNGLIELDGPPLRNERLAAPISDQQSWRQSLHVRAFERGEIGAELFIERVLAEQGIQLAPEVFKRQFSAWPKAPFPGALALLERLRGGYVLGFYSNINELHWPRLVQQFNLGTYVDHVFACYQYWPLQTRGRRVSLRHRAIGTAARDDSISR